ncbi:MAG: malate dehydrogenase [Gammaproteobacteria bacterium]|nr:malate dehydrogenase [Gammaproteobacteria bacterium]
MNQEDKQKALEYHANPIPGKIAISITKSTQTQRDLSLAYTPGVAEPVREISKDPNNAYKYTNKGNLVAVISNGSAVLGLGDVGALASKPVMEGKAVLFKKFADIDVFDIEIASDSPEDLINTIARIAPTFGGINLEDIKAPECFAIEQALIERLDIPVFHDDQHGTAIIVAAGLLNALEIVNKQLENIRIVCLGAGAAGIASMRLLTALGAKKEHLFMVDRQGVVNTARLDLSPHKFAFANDDINCKTLKDALENADVFIGVSGANLLPVEYLQVMAKDPIVFALSNPDPEIEPHLAHAARADLIMATGRSDYPNQVNNVLGFPYIFRGALDVQATCINQDMHIAAVEAIRSLAKEPVPKDVMLAYPDTKSLSFGRDYIIPKPFDLRLKTRVSDAVAKAAIATGVACKNI